MEMFFVYMNSKRGKSVVFSNSMDSEGKTVFSVDSEGGKTSSVD